MATDPICKMEIEPTTARLKSAYKGKEYYFCSSVCKTTFDRTHERYA